MKRPSDIPLYLLYLVVLGAIVFAIWHYQVLDLLDPNSPRATAKAFMHRIYAGDIDGAEKLCTTETQPLLAPLERQAERRRRTAETEQPTKLSWRATAAEVAGDQAMVTIKQTLSQGASTESLTLLIALANENGEWRVDLADGVDPLMGLTGLSKRGVAPRTP